MHRKSQKAGVTPSTYVLDNETSKDLIQAFEQENLDHQLVTPCKYHKNIAERVSQTYKSHFKSGLAAKDFNFPLSE